MKKLKLAILTTHPPGKGTLNEYGFYWVKEFLKRKEDLSEIVLLSDVLPDNLSYNFNNKGVKISVDECWKFNNFFNIITVLRAVLKHKPDVVLFNLQFLSFGDKKIAAALGLLLPFFTKLVGSKSVVLLHNIIEEVDYTSAGFTSNKLLIKVFDFIGTVLTRFVLGANLVGVTIEKYVHTLKDKYNAKNVALIPHGSFEVPELPNMSLPKGPLQVMTFGKFGTYKKVEILIDAVEIIRKRSNLHIEIVIAGTDNPNVKGYLDDVKKQYQNVSNIRFTGYVEEEDVPGLFNDAAVVVFPYTSTTGSSGVLHQAGSYGNAVVLPDLGDLGRLVIDEGFDGLFFDPLDAGSLADAIQELLENEDLRVSQGMTNYYASTNLPMEDIVDWYLLHFDNLV